MHPDSSLFAWAKEVEARTTVNWKESKGSGGEGGIRTLGTGVSPYNGLANRRIRPLCHLSVLCYLSLADSARAGVSCLSLMSEESSARAARRASSGTPCT